MATTERAGLTGMRLLGIQVIFTAAKDLPISHQQLHALTVLVHLRFHKALQPCSGLRSPELLLAALLCMHAWHAVKSPAQRTGSADLISGEESISSAAGSAAEDILQA